MSLAPSLPAAANVPPLLLLVAAALFGGCSSTPPGSRARVIAPRPPPDARMVPRPTGQPADASQPPATLFETCRALNLTPTTDLLCVSVGEQRLHWYRGARTTDRQSFVLHRTFPCSTSTYGVGQQLDSYRTPLGLHRVKEKIGAGMPRGTIFKARQPVGYTWRDDPHASITTRIFWLEGLEPGFNRGGTVDSHARYIYIHGTGRQSRVGRPGSHGCIHLRDEDLVNLFDNTPSGTMVWIAED